MSEPWRLPIDQVLVAGVARGRVLQLEQPLSFWGGLDPDTGRVIDRHHPQCGSCIAGKILLMPGVRGSTAGPGALLESLYAGTGPSGILLARPEVAIVSAVTAAGFLELPLPPVAVAARATDILAVVHQEYVLDCSA